MRKSSKNDDNYRPRKELEFSEEDIFHIYSMIDKSQGFGLKFSINMFRSNRKIFAKQDNPMGSQELE